MIMFIKLVTIYLIVRTTQETSAAGDSCSASFMISTWNFSESPSPTNLTLGFNASSKVIEVRSTHMKKDFCLSLFAIPLNDGDKAECSPVLERSLDVRRFWSSFSSSRFRDKHDTNTLSISYGNIFHGCYYFVMSNVDTGETWQWEPKIFKTNYSLVNTRLSIDNEVQQNSWIKPGDSTRYRYTHIPLRVPLDCMQVQVALYELTENIPPNAMNEIENWKIPESQKYCFTKVPGKNEFTVTSAVSELFTSIRLNVTKVDKIDSDSGSSDGYIAIVHWDKLGSKPGRYYFYYWGNYHTELCDGRYDHTNLNSWRLLKEVNFVELDDSLFNDSNEPSIAPKDQLWNSTIQTTVSVFVVGLTLILAFWILKCYRMWKRKNIETTDLPGVVMKSAFVSYKENSDKIMLIYVEDSPVFKEKMNQFREDLKKARCFNVHDMFDPEEWNKIAQFGNRWVEELLIAGSKVIWVDTPKFRSYVNDPRKEETDFRGPATSHAVSLATDLFTNSSTQYLRHFVVRVEGFEVTDKYDDPLLVISPYRRYHLPEHLDQLLKDLSDGTTRNWQAR